MSATASTPARTATIVGWTVLLAGLMFAMVWMDRFHDLPLYAFWCSLALFFLVQRTSKRVIIALLVVALAMTVVVILRAVLDEHKTLIEATDIPIVSMLPLLLAWYGSRYRTAMMSLARLASEDRARLERERRFFRNASHELRTPLTVARGHLDLALSDLGTPAARDDLVVATEELKRLSVTVEHLMTLAMAEQGDFVRTTIVDVRVLMTLTARRWVPVTRRGWSVDMGPAGSIEIDPGRIGAALDALIENAVAFTEPSDDITLRASVRGDLLTLSVTDTGCGVAPEHLGTIFDEFSRHNRRLTQGSGGTGLGLAIVRTIAEGHGGRVSVESTLGRGTTVSIHLPGFRPAPSALSDQEVA
jgi:signal transduction histidine kinase